MEKCKFCQEELAEGSTVCPHCGKDNAPETETVTPAEEVTEGTAAPEEAAAEQTGTETPVEEEATDTAEQPVSTEEVPVETPAETPEAPKTAPWKIVAAVAAVVVLIAALAALVIGGVKGGKATAETTVPETTVSEPAATETQVPATVPADGNPNDVTCKGTYTVSDEDVIDAHDTVVARMGNYTLTNGQLQMFYWTEVRNFLSSYGSYASYFGLDLTKPLDVQTCAIADTQCTWQQFFLTNALNSWRNCQATTAEAETSGFCLDDETQAQLDAAIKNLESSAPMYGFENAEELLKNDVGVGANLEDYSHFLKIYYTGSIYFSDLCQAQDPTDEEVEKYFDENAEAYEKKGLTKDSKTVDVRHVLVMPEGATTDNIRTDTFDDAAWEASRRKAEELLAQWEQGEKNEDSFAELAKANSQDGSASDGGLYTGVAEGQMVKEFNDWCFDDVRQPGDYGIVKTEFGYHLMFFVGSNPIWKDSARSDLSNARANELLSTILDKHTVETDFGKIKLGYASLGA